MANILWVPAIFAGSSYFLYWLSCSLPNLETVDGIDSSALKFPSSIEELSALSALLNQYKLHHWNLVFALFACGYLWKQSFAIPGSVFLNMLAGALFGPGIGFVLTCLLTATGATNCYLLSNFFGKSYIVKYFPDKLAMAQQKIEENRDSLFFFLLFLRLFPMAPNWFMNIASPILNVPVHLFFLSVLIGLMPYNFICVETGCILSQINSLDDIFNFWTWIKLFGMATTALIPALLLKNYQQSRSKSKTSAPTCETSAPTCKTSAPTSETSAPTSETSAPTSKTTAPTSESEGKKSQ